MQSTSTHEAKRKDERLAKIRHNRADREQESGEDKMTAWLFKWILRLRKRAFEKQIGRDFDRVLSRKLDCIQFLLEN
jgi:hypothetical protein